MELTFINPEDDKEQQNKKLVKIIGALMRRSQYITDEKVNSYTHFHRAVTLEEKVNSRTSDLKRALDLLKATNVQLFEAKKEAEEARSNLADAIEAVQEGFCLFDKNDELIMCNSRFAMFFPDVQEHLKPGLAFKHYVERISQSPFLMLDNGETPNSWIVRRLKQHQDDNVVFNLRLEGDRWLQVSERRIQEGGTVILQTDLTEIIRSEREEREKILDEQARIVRATLEHINQGVCIFDAQNCLVGSNRRVGELLSIPVKRLRLGMDFFVLFEELKKHTHFSPENTSDCLIEWVRSSKRGRSLSFELTRGQLTVLDVFVQEMPDRGFVISFSDVTAERNAIKRVTEANESLEQRVMERTLELEDALNDAERANASKSRFVAAASHDLLQPLSAAKLYMSSLLDNGISSEMRDTIERAQSALLSVEDILGALLDISKLESGRAVVDVTPFNLRDIMRQMRDEFTPAADLKGLALRIVETTVVVESDASYLRRILQNLIANAIRYTPHGRVLVGARRKDNVLRIEVWDTGPGIHESEQVIIFREFHRLNASASASEGMGLGLAIVERACALLGHPVHLKSQLGKGTCFFIDVPISKEAPIADARTHIFSEWAQEADRGTIVLLIENDNELRRALSLQLEKWAIDVLDARSGNEAIELLDEIGVAPDILLVDYQLDDGEIGLDAIKRIKEKFGPIPACVMTADRSKQIEAQCREDAKVVLHKPLDLNALRSFLASRGS